MAPGFQFETKTLELVRGNLSDRASRHIMLLTQNAAALQLLFDGGLLREQEVDVLFGSRFPDDVSELQLVQQVNRVKYVLIQVVKTMPFIFPICLFHGAMYPPHSQSCCR